MLNSTTQRLILVIFTLTISSSLTLPQYSLLDSIKPLAVAQSANELKEKAEQMEEDAILSFQAGRAPDAIRLMEQALSIYRQLQDEKQERRVLENFGTLFLSLKDYQRVIEYVKPSLRLARKLQDLESEESALFKIARAYRELKDNKQAEKYYQEAFQASTSLKNAEGVMIALGNLGQIYQEAQNFDQAIAAYTQAGNIAKQIQDLPKEKLALSALAQVYLTRGMKRYQSGDRSGAVQDLQQSANFLKQQGDTEGYQKVKEIIQGL